MPLPPGLNGYMQMRQLQDQEQGQQVQQLTGLAALQGHMEDRQQEQKIREVMSQSGGDPEVAMKALISSGHYKAATLLTPLLKEQLAAKQSAASQTHLQAGVNQFLTPPPPQPGAQQMQQQAGGMLANLQSPSGSFGQGTPAENPNSQVFGNDASAIQAAQAASARGEPFRGNVPNPQNVQALSAIANPPPFKPDMRSFAQHLLMNPQTAKEGLALMKELQAAGKLQPIGSGGALNPDTNAIIPPQARAGEADAWSEPYQIGGATVQKNKTTGQIRQAVAREPAIPLRAIPDPSDPAKGVWGTPQAGQPAFAPGAAGMAGVGMLSPETLKFTAQQILAGDRSAGVGYARSMPMKAALQNAVVKEAGEQGISGKDLAAITAEYQGFQAGQRTVGTRQANIEIAATVTKQFVPLAITASENFDRTGIKTLNDVEKAALSRTSSPELRRFNMANNALINGYARAINPTGVGTMSDKDHAREVLDTGFSKGDYKAAAEQLLLEIETELKAPGTVKRAMRAQFNEPVTTGSVTNPARRASDNAPRNPTVDALLEKYK